MLGSLVKTINRHQWIAEAAYFIAETRNLEPGKELDDWLEAEISCSEMLISTYVAMLAEDGPITIVGLKQLATLIGIENTDSLNTEIELVKAIQNASGHRPCFRTEDISLCDGTECQWKSECQRLISVWYSD